MLNQNRAILIAVFALALVTLACGPPLTSSGGQPAPIEEVTLDPVDPATEEPAEPTEPVVTEEPAADPGPSCPTAGEDTSLHRDDENGFCFLYPSVFEVNPDWDQGLEDGVTIVSPPLDPNAIESLISFAQVINAGPAGDLTTAQLYADAWAEAYFPPEFIPNFTRSEETIGGQPAVVLGNIPGRLSGRSAFIVANGYRYHITIFPQPGDFENLDAAFGDVWGTITGSVVFYTPSVPREAVRAEDVCPTATADTFLHVNVAQGYCFLVPSAFEQDTESAGTSSSWFVGGPLFDTGTTMGEMQARIVFSWFGPAQDKTPMELTDGFVAETGEPRQELTVAGYPAVEFYDPRGPVPSQTLMMVAENNTYSLVANPYDAARWPESTTLLDQAWDSVVGTLTFFDRLR